MPRSATDGERDTVERETIQQLNWVCRRAFRQSGVHDLDRNCCLVLFSDVRGFLELS